MTTWTKTQIDQVRGLRSYFLANLAMIDRARVNVVAEIKNRMARDFINHAHPFAVEVHPYDLQFSEEKEGQHIKFRCWWEPQVRLVEFKGGAEDGKLYEIRDAPGPVRVAVYPTVNWAKIDETSPIGPITPGIQIWEMTGWSESERHWIYEATS